MDVCLRHARLGRRTISRTSSIYQALCSVAATLLHHHVLVMLHDHLPVLVVQHGERSQAGGNTGQTRHRVRAVQLQQTLERETEQ